MNVTDLNRQAEQYALIIKAALQESSQIVIGQKSMMDRLMMGLITEGHILLEGLPGLAKTLAVKTLAQILDLPFSRIQFTPDLLPSDLIGTMVFNQKSGEFHPKKGPIFTSILLADEINRTPPKVQSALLEAMAEKQVTIGDTTYELPDPFIVLATQNPIEQEGTYVLPEAQLDRFMFKVHVGYPSRSEEKEIITLTTGNNPPKIRKMLDAAKLVEIRNFVKNIYVDDKVKDYVVSLVYCTRAPQEYRLPELAKLISIGGSPRASINLIKAAKAQALLSGRGFVTPDDIRAVAYDILRHRLILTYESEAEGVDSPAIIKKIIDNIPVP